MMTKNCLFAVALLSVAMCAGCSGNGKNGNGAARVAVNPTGQTSVGLTLPQQFTADVTGVDNHAVTWQITQNGAACSPGCGTISTNGLYTAPATVPNPSTVTVTASAVANDGAFGSATAKVVPITVLLSPNQNNAFEVARAVTQQFTATATPDNAPQTFTWTLTCDAGANLCGTLDQNGLYTAPNSVPNPATAHVKATSTVQTNPVASATVDITIVSSRLAGSTTYAFRLSGFDAGGNFIGLAGNFLTNGDGTAILGGNEDELTGSTHKRCSILGTSTFALDANDHGTLILRTSAGVCSVNARTFRVALSSGGDGQILEFDGISRTSGIVALANAKFTNSVLKAGSSFVFGLTGVDTTVKRTGYVGLIKPDGVGGITSGLLDINDNAVAKSSANLAGSSYNINPDGSGTMTLTTDIGTLNFALYVVSGTTNANNPLTLFVISADDPQTAPAQVGTIVFRDPALTGGNGDLNAPAVSNLTGVSSTGVNTLVSLTVAGGDANGHISGSYDANNAGTIVAAKTFSSYAYACASSGRCTVDLLGDPAANPVVPPVHFVLYLSAANRGFLLDQSSTAVMTGTMDPQKGGFFAPSELAGPFAAATTSSGTTGVSQVEANLLLTSPGGAVFNVGGSQDATDAGGQHAAQTLTGTYDVDASGIGTIVLTAPAAANYVIYAIDNPPNGGNLVQHFYIMNVDPANTDSSIVFAER